MINLASCTYSRSEVKNVLVLSLPFWHVVYCHLEAWRTCESIYRSVGAIFCKTLLISLFGNTYVVTKAAFLLSVRSCLKHLCKLTDLFLNFHFPPLHLGLPLCIPIIHKYGLSFFSNGYKRRIHDCIFFISTLSTASSSESLSSSAKALLPLSSSSSSP